MEPENHRSEPRLNQKDIHAIKEVISKVKSAGLFDQFRKECLADVDTKPAYHNLIQRVEKFVERFLNSQKWNADLNKNQLRETLRRQLNNSGVMNIGVDRIIEQVVNPKILQGIKPKIDEAICDYFGINLKTLHTEQQKRKQQQQQQYVQQHQQFQFNSLQNFISHQVKTEDAFGAVPEMCPTMSTYPWLPASADASFQGTANSGIMTNTELATSVNHCDMSGISYNPHSFSGMMQPYYMGNWMLGMDSFNPSMQPVISGQPLIHSQSMSAFGDSGFPLFDADVTPFGTTLSSSLECSSTAFDTPSMPILLPSIPTHVPPDTPLLSSTTSIGSPRAPDIAQQPSSVAPPGFFVTAGGSAIKPPPPGSIPPPPGTVPVVAPAPYTILQSSLQPMHVTVDNTPLISHNLSKESPVESVPETSDLFRREHLSIPRPAIVPDTNLASGWCSFNKLPLAAETMRGHETDSNSWAVSLEEEMATLDSFKLENKGDNENGRKAKTQDMQFEHDHLPLQHSFGDIQIAGFLSENEGPK